MNDETDAVYVIPTEAPSDRLALAIDKLARQIDGLKAEVQRLEGGDR